MKALIIDEPWIELILRGEKTWEMRTRDTRVRGPIGLIRKGSKSVVGVAELIDTRPRLSIAELRATAARHCVSVAKLEDPGFRWTTAWVLAGARRLPRPVPYRFLRGAVISIANASSMPTSPNPRIWRLRILWQKSSTSA